MDGIVWRANPAGKIIDTRSWLQLTGETADEWERLSSLHPDDRKSFMAAWDSAIATTGRFACSVRLKLRDGKYTQARSSAFPYFDAKGRIEYWVGYTILGADRSAPMDIGSLTPPLIRAARALLDWSAMELAEKAGVSFSTVRRIEKTVTSVRPEMIRSVLRTFERHGVSFGSHGPLSLSLSGDVIN